MEAHITQEKYTTPDGKKHHDIHVVADRDTAEALVAFVKAMCPSAVIK